VLDPGNHRLGRTVGAGRSATVQTAATVRTCAIAGTIVLLLMFALAGIVISFL
jgi:hypothetical protein